VQIPSGDIGIQFYAPVSGEDLVSDILLEAQEAHCDTIVVGRETFSGLQRVLKHHVADDLIRRGHDHTIWVVE
jgi:K+-sensing histidine kinase KdpD